MSSFYCPKCSKEIIDTPGKGYITGCVHFSLTKQRPTKPSGIPQEILDILKL